MSYSKSIVPGILIKSKGSLGYRDTSEDRFYILTEIETDYNDRAHDMLVFYGLTEEQFFRRPHWRIEKYIEDGIIKIVA